MFYGELKEKDDASFPYSLGWEVGAHYVLNAVRSSWFAFCEAHRVPRWLSDIIDFYLVDLSQDLDHLVSFGSGLEEDPFAYSEETDPEF